MKIVILSVVLLITSQSLYCFTDFTILSPFGCILDPSGIPRWKKLNSHIYKNNIFHITTNINKGTSIATGFVLDDKSPYIITNAHVALMARGLNAIDSMFAENSNGRIKIKRIALVSKELDFALLEFEWISKKINLEKFKIVEGEMPYKDEAVYVLGFAPGENSFIISKGAITATEYSREKKPCFKYNADTEAGMSGSPVFNSKNELIGLHYGSPEQGTNNAIPFQMIIEQNYASFNLDL